VELHGENSYSIDEVTQGDTITEVLQYVDYSPAVLVNKLRDNIEAALKRGTMTLEESKQLMQRFQDGLKSYTYLE
jgi:arginine decarboxylase